MSTTLTPYLSVEGKTREAFAFYEKALGAKIETMMSYADMPASANDGYVMLELAQNLAIGGAPSLRLALSLTRRSR